MVDFVLLFGSFFVLLGNITHQLITVLLQEIDRIFEHVGIFLDSIRVVFDFGTLVNQLIDLFDLVLIIVVENIDFFLQFLVVLLSVLDLTPLHLDIFKKMVDFEVDFLDFGLEAHASFFLFLGNHHAFVSLLLLDVAQFER